MKGEFSFENGDEVEMEFHPLLPVSSNTLHSYITYIRGRPYERISK
jgi:hypothetical protein